MDYNKLADLIFADITDTVDDLEKRFPERNLPENKGNKICTKPYRIYAHRRTVCCHDL